jgi:hypothetical protein
MAYISRFTIILGICLILTYGIEKKRKRFDASVQNCLIDPGT